MFVRDSDPRSEVLQRISETFGINPSWLLVGTGDKVIKEHNDVQHIQESLEGRLIPFLDQKASAGPGKVLLEDDHKGRVIRIPNAVSTISELYALEVSGDSMYPTLNDGDVVVCDSAGWQGDGIYVLRTHECEYVKRVVLTPDGYHVISDNTMYPPYNCKQNDTEVIGRVRCAVVKM